MLRTARTGRRRNSVSPLTRRASAFAFGLLVSYWQVQEHASRESRRPDGDMDSIDHTSDLKAGSRRGWAKSDN
eukprot:3935234-Prymnesium_polylepis.2